MKTFFFLIIFFYLPFVIQSQSLIEWQKTFGGNLYDQAYSVVQTPDGYIVAGITSSSNVEGYMGGADCWLIKLDHNGNAVWKRVYGGTGNDEIRSVNYTRDGGYFIAGYSESNDHDVSGNHGGISDGWVAKINSVGDIEWQKALGGSGWDDVRSAQQTTDNGYILAGRSNSLNGDVSDNKGDQDVWVIKLTATGDIEWERSLGGSERDMGWSIKQSSDGGYIVVGETASNDGDVSTLLGNVDIWVVKLSPEGYPEWEKSLGGAHGDTGSDVIQTKDGGYAVTGFVGSGNIPGFHGILDYFVVKLNSEGDIEWQNIFGGSSVDYARAIVQLEDNGYAIFGSADSTDGDVIGNNGGTEYWLVKISETGELIWQKTYGGNKAEFGFAMNNTSDKGLILAGYAWSSNNGDLIGSQNQGSTDFWVVKLSPETVGLNDPQSNIQSLEIYPNPSQQSIYLKLPQDESELNITISDMLGRKLLTQKSFHNQALNISLFPTGLYIITALTSDGKVFQGKFEKN